MYKKLFQDFFLSEKHHVRKLQRQYQNKRENIAPSSEYNSIIMYKGLEQN